MVCRGGDIITDLKRKVKIRTHNRQVPCSSQGRATIFLILNQTLKQPPPMKTQIIIFMDAHWTLLVVCNYDHQLLTNHHFINS